MNISRNTSGQMFPSLMHGERYIYTYLFVNLASRLTKMSDAGCAARRLLLEKAEQMQADEHKLRNLAWRMARVLGEFAPAGGDLVRSEVNNFEK